MLLSIGVGYTSSCKPCTPGFYADKRAAQACTPCPRNTYSDSYNSTRCKPCDTNMYYSEPGSSTCLPRPQCTHSDYYQLHTPCSRKNQVRKCLNTFYYIIFSVLLLYFIPCIVLCHFRCKLYTNGSNQRFAWLVRLVYQPQGSRTNVLRVTLGLNTKTANAFLAELMSFQMA